MKHNILSVFVILFAFVIVFAIWHFFGKSEIPPQNNIEINQGEIYEID